MMFGVLGRISILLLTLRCALVYTNDSYLNNTVSTENSILQNNIGAPFNIKLSDSLGSEKVSRIYSATTLLPAFSPTDLDSFPKKEIKFFETYALPSRALFTPPLPPEYANPFADKPTLRGTSSELQTFSRRHMPPPSLTPVEERIPIKPPDLIHNSPRPNVNLEEVSKKKSANIGDTRKDINHTSNLIPSLHLTSISRILSGSNGKKQDIPDVLLKPLTTMSVKTEVVLKDDVALTTLRPAGPKKVNPGISIPYIYSFPSTNNGPFVPSDVDNKSENSNRKDIITDHNRKVLYPVYPVLETTGTKSVYAKNHNVTALTNTSTLKYSWKIVWTLHVYFTAIAFTVLSLFSIYKILYYSNNTNFLSEFHFLGMHLLIAIFCTLRCFYLFYDAYNLLHSFSEVASNVLMYLPSGILAISFAVLINYLYDSSSVSCLMNKQCLSPIVIIAISTVKTLLCIILLLLSYIVGFNDKAKLVAFICQCSNVIIYATLGLYYMYLYRIMRSQICNSKAKSFNDDLPSNMKVLTLTTAITTCIAIALLFILMGFMQLYGIIFIGENLQMLPWLWWAWEFSVRLLELSLCGLLICVSGLSNFRPLKKGATEIDAQIMPSFAFYPCRNTFRRENVEDVLYPTIDARHQEVNSCSLRTEEQIFGNSFPLNKLPIVERTSKSDIVKNSSSANNFNVNVKDNPNCQNVRKDRNQTHALQGQFGSTYEAHYFYDYCGKSASYNRNPTMLVAEDGFVRFRSIAPDENKFLDSSSFMEASNGTNCPTNISAIPIIATLHCHSSAVSIIPSDTCENPGIHNSPNLPDNI